MPSASGKRTLKPRPSMKGYKKNMTRSFNQQHISKPQTIATTMGPPGSKNRRFNMRYATLITLNSTSASLGIYKFRANSIQDPDVSIGAGQTRPYGYDQWATLYNHYVVTGSRMTCKLIGGEYGPNCLFGTYLSDDASIPYNKSTQFIMTRKGTWKCINGLSGKIETCTNKFSARKFFNVKDPKDVKKTIGAAFGADPTENVLFNVWFQNVKSTDQPQTVNVLVVIDYVGECGEPKDVLPSL